MQTLFSAKQFDKASQQQVFPIFAGIGENYERCYIIFHTLGFIFLHKTLLQEII